jgi:uncharacterized protein YqgV (UPF0045/DUF77 family)
MPVPPAELTAEVTVDAGRGPADDRAVGAMRQVAAASGLALDAGPATTALSGAKGEVLDALRRVLDAALDAGAGMVDVRLEVPRQARGDPGPG